MLQISITLRAQRTGNGLELRKLVIQGCSAVTLLCGITLVKSMFPNLGTSLRVRHRVDC